ncbi:glycosyltransferase family 4 protein [Vibrio splendidus]|uniref:glycosyltransferase family 4 protein n=1 Tax=Vibrio splendidus TaxID=29497 RepID=UPI00352F69EA
MFIGHYSGQNNDFDTRNFYLAKELVKRGYKVTIVSSAFSHRLKNPELFTQNFKVIDDESGITLVKIKSPYYKGNGLRRLINMLSFSFNFCRAVDDIVKVVSKPEHVILSYPHPFQVLPAIKIKKLYGAQLITDMRDIWPASVVQLTGSSKLHPVVLVMQYLEYLCVKHSDRFISPLPNIGTYLYEKFTNNKPVEYLPQVLDFEMFNSKFTDDTTLRKRFSVCYVGGLTSSNAVEILLKAAKFSELNNNIEYFIVGSGALEETLKEEYSQLKNVYFVGHVSKDIAFSYMAKADLLYRGEPNLPLYKYGVAPLKLNEYMLSGTPIIQCSDYPEFSLVSTSGCGVTVAYGDVEGLHEGIVEFSNTPEDKRLAIGERGRKYVLKNNGIKTIVDKLTQLLTNVDRHSH